MALGLRTLLLASVAGLTGCVAEVPELRDGRLDTLLGPRFQTRFDDAVAATVTRFFPAEGAGTMDSEPNLNAILTRA